MNDKPLLLLVEDEPISLELLNSTLQDFGYVTVTASTGADAWERVVQYRNRFDAILLDRVLPDMDSLSLLLKLKSDPGMTHVPVIMQTSLSSEADVADGLKAGAYYYLTKPFPPSTLLSIVRSAVKDRRDYLELLSSLQQARGIFSQLIQAEFWFRTQSEARDLATMAAHAAPDPGRVVLGLTELMLNAVEHGNLEISYAEKGALIADNALDREVERRLVQPAYAERRARLKIDHCPDCVCFEVSDEGAGFDWSPYMEMSPERAFDTHGRGIAMSRLVSFDKMEYRGAGNQVLCCVTAAKTA